LPAAVSRKINPGVNDAGLEVPNTISFLSPSKGAHAVDEYHNALFEEVSKKIPPFAVDVGMALEGPYEINLSAIVYGSTFADTSCNVKR
jgi:hypothetical protein